METIVAKVEGDELLPGKCHFCDNQATKIFGVLGVGDEKRYNGHPLLGFHVCKTHVGAINSLLDGTKDINLLIKAYEQVRSGRAINLRA